MRKSTALVVGAILLLGVVAATIGSRGPAPAPVKLPAAAVDEPLAPHPGSESVVLAGGCFWGVQAVFEHVRGVISATDGYAGGDADTARYETVSTGRTGHAESVRVLYDPSRITLGELLRVFFSVAHNPTEWNRQGPDVGTQYRSAIFYANADQLRIARAYILQLDNAKMFRRPIVTELTPLTPERGFYTAEAYHQDYARLHPDDLYIRINDLPKVAALKAEWPQMSR